MSSSNPIANDRSKWIVWHNQGSGNRTVRAHARYFDTDRTLCGRSPGDLVTQATATTPKCQKCMKVKQSDDNRIATRVSDMQKQFAQPQSMTEGAKR